MHQKEIKTYYDHLACTYDKDRFNNTYGQYIDAQERNFLTSFFDENQRLKTILDLGCGTGRLLSFATDGVDFSNEMLAQAKAKHPGKNLQPGSITEIPYENNSFDCIFSFHVIMHQNKETTQRFLSESWRKLNRNGFLIFDYPTRSRRRNIVSTEQWHAGNSFTSEEISFLICNHWKIIETRGVLFFPVHRIPKSLRRFFLPLDNFLCRSFFKKWASYQILVLQKVA
ncbi:methyltransferase type 11 [Elizabethkingia meningoseptica]|uniref:SAM-dependent methyltransferase n=1 Tax=Elizabethkingia meningoseptica TaxID=238 RepID=A0A1V3U4L5_ELIME|nr:MULTISPECIES: class I SAM-dependent methyltransferase [Elizabethkingia]AQX11334.1 methyltransferase type 11 [Elizabethkingia meningoseptica]MBG0512680.1 class I SAM-dependent methyltransferase [Elizabethkingia meningoseptica]MDE5435282.1 class I SAM-dependent methyltransferase [Elizabethkingia meningoseptica]MDE5450302.1 class I SAM-dependent methyltransferase [Elizabethkingia meningoseptica]MDE5472078.1 class I SAM-dependent methyltransferase [Elizabethkingia meningoseptica]